MKILEALSMSSAFCMDRSGNVYDVYVHPFGSLEEDSIEDAAWLLAVKDSKVSDICLNYLAGMMCELYYNGSTDDFLDEVKEEFRIIECLKKYYSYNYIANDVVSFAKKNNFDFSGLDLDSLGNQIKSYLNQNYIRIRFGSEFQTSADREGSIYFRLSSSGYDWYNNIVKFLDDFSRSHRIKDITIEKDKESSGSNTIYANHVPFTDFLLNKKIIIECCLGE